MSHLKAVFGDAEVHSTGMRYTFDSEGNQTGSYAIAGIGADLDKGLANVGSTPVAGVTSEIIVKPDLI